MRPSACAILLGLGLAVAGCTKAVRPTGPGTTRGPVPAPEPAAPPWAGLPRVASNDGTYTIAWRAPDPIPVNEDFDLSIWVIDAATGAPARGATLEIDARMPHHRHGMVQVPDVVPRADGGFDVGGMLCHMTGYWEILMDVSRDGITERAQLPVNLE